MANFTLTVGADTVAGGAADDTVNGTAATREGDPVFQHDTIETAADGAVGITFSDGTAFNLSSNARMVVSEFVCVPNGTSNSALRSLVQGAFSFIAGKVAKTGGLRIDTPVARIRGTAQHGGMGILTLAALTFSVMKEIQAAGRSDAFLDDDTITYKALEHGTFEITTRDGRVIVADDPGETIQITPDGDVTRTPKTSSQVEQGAALAQQVASLSLGQGAAPGGSSTPTFDIPLQPQPINFSPPANNDAAPQPVTINITAQSSGFVEVAQPKPPPPVLVADAGLHTITEVHNVTGSTGLDTASSAALSFIDLKLSTVSASLASITWSGGATPSEVAAVLAGALSVTAETTGFDAGSITTTFSATDKNFDFLAAGETLTIVYNVTVTDNNGVSVTQPVTIIATGTNDVPVLAADTSGPYTVSEGLNTTGTLTFTDVDLNDQHTVSTSVTSATWSGGATLPSGLAAVLAGALSTTTTDSTGSGSGSIAATFSAADSAFDFLGAGQTLKVTYDVTVTDNNGVGSTQPVTFTITGTNDAPTLQPVTGPTYTDTGALDHFTAVTGTLSATDVDLPAQTLTYGIVGGSADNSLTGYNVSLTGTYGTLYVNSTSGEYIFVPNDTAIKALSATTTTQNFTFTVSDGSLSAAQDIVVTINGANDVTFAIRSASEATGNDSPTQSATISEENTSDNAGTFTISKGGDALTGSDTASLTVTMSGTATDADFSSAVIAAVAGAATTAGLTVSGVTATSLTVTWVAGDPTSFNVDLTAFNDQLVESGETLTLALSGETVANGLATLVAGQSAASLTITDIDQSIVFNVTVNDASISEEGLESATFTISHTGGPLNAGNTATVTVDVAALGTATGDSDYTDDILNAIATAATAAGVGFNTTTGVLTFTSASATTFNVTVSALNDDLLDSGETVQINLVAGSATITEGNATIGTGSASTTITDIDTADSNDFDNKVPGINTPPYVFGTTGADTITGGGNSGQVIYGGASADTINGTGRDDLIFGGSGDDTLKGNNGEDIIFGGSGIDTISGSNDNDVIYGGFGADILTGSNGNDFFVYLSVADSYGDQFDTITDFTSGDKIDLTSFGATALTNGFQPGMLVTATSSVAPHTIAWYYDSANNQTIVYANPTDDPSLNGGSFSLVEIHLTGVSSVQLNNFSLASSNPLIGGSGADTIIGTSGNDTINGGFYADTLMGNGGIDTFVYSSLADSRGGLFDTITDFTGGISGDKIDLTAFGTALTTFKTGGLLTATGSVAAHTIAWFYDSVHNQTIVYVNPTNGALNGGVPDLLEIHLTGNISLVPGNFSTLNALITTAPAGIAGEPINLGLSALSAEGGALITVAIADVPSGWTVNGGTLLNDATWTVQTSDPGALTVTSPADFTGAMVLNVTETWTQADGSTVSMNFADNVEVYPVGSPIFALSDNDFLTGSSGKDLFVFSQPIGNDTIYNFNPSVDQIDLIGYAGFASFDDVKSHLTADANGNAAVTLANGQTITLNGVAAASLAAGNFVFDQMPVTNNAGTMTISEGAVLPLSGIINNTGIIALDSIGNDTHLELIQYGITLQGGGQLILSDSGENFISGTIPSVMLTNVDNTISGAGQLGAGQMTLVNDGTIVATGSYALDIDTGANVVTNIGTLEATGTGGLIVNSDISNSGLIWAYGGNITINGAVTGSGTAMINGTATLEFGASSSNDVIFTADAAGTLILDHSLMQPFSAVISGLGADDAIDLKDLAFTSGHMTATTSFANGNTTLVVSNTSTNQSVTFALAGDYTHSTWDFAQDSFGAGTIFHDLPATDVDAETVSGSTSMDLTLTVTAALTLDGTSDQFTFQSDSQSGTLAGDLSVLASKDDASPIDETTSDTASTSSGDSSPTATASTCADSNIATNTQAVTDGLQAGTDIQTVAASPAAPSGSNLTLGALV